MAARFHLKCDGKTARVPTRKALISRHFLPTPLSWFTNRTKVHEGQDDRARHATSGN